MAEHDRIHPGAFCNVFSFQFENPNAPLAHELVVLVPIHASVERQYVNSCLYLLKQSVGDFRTCRIIFDTSGEAPPRGPHPYRQEALAKIRQDMVDRHIGEANWVAWIDADIVFYPPYLLRMLVERADGGIAAPMVVMDGVPGMTGQGADDGFGPGRFFDVAGFVENLRWARFTQPWFDQQGPVYSLDSVGSCYVVNAEIYRAGARHVADPYSMEFVRRGLKWTKDTILLNQQEPANCFTEHFSVCQWAKENGFPVRGFGDLIARHARR